MIRTLATLAAVLLLALAGCGGDDESSGGSSGGSSGSSGGGGGQQLALAAPQDGSLKFDKTELEAKAGTVTINLDNPATIPHAVEIEGNGVEEKSDTVTGGEASVTADLKPGEYTFYCPVEGHRAGGMEGTLTVK
jgi:plastocyanin